MAHGKNSRYKTRLEVKKNVEKSGKSGIRVLDQSEAILLGLNPIIILNRVNTSATRSRTRTSALSADNNKTKTKKGRKRVPLSKICSYCHKKFTTGTARLKHEMIHRPKEFHCPHSDSGCSRSFTYAHTLQIHLNHKHSDQRPHPCPFPDCGAAFKSVSNLYVHQRIHTGERPFTCPHPNCHKSFTQNGILQEHVKCVHASGENSYPCSHSNCGKKFKTAKILSWHLRHYHDGLKFKCSLCPRAFKVKSGVDLHMRSHTKEKPFSCTWPDCSKSFSAGSALKSHFRIHSGQKPFQCRYSNPDPDSGTNSSCQMAFRRDSGRKAHEQRHHVRVKTHPCKFQGCLKKFFTASEVTSHFRAHTKEKPHKCATCGRHYANSSSLKTHQMKEHKKTHEFPCSLCSKKYYVKPQLEFHMKSHDKIRKCKFPKCKRVFNLYKNLTTHYKEEHRNDRYLKCPVEGGKCASRIFTSHRDWAAHIRRHNSPGLEEKVFAKYWCTFNTSECSKYFGSKTSLGVHMRSHTGERPFGCPLEGCQKAYRQKPHLEEHVKRIHRKRAGKKR